MINITAIGAAHANFSLNNLNGFRPFQIFEMLLSNIYSFYNLEVRESNEQN